VDSHFFPPDPLQLPRQRREPAYQSVVLHRPCSRTEHVSPRTRAWSPTARWMLGRRRMLRPDHATGLKQRRYHFLPPPPLLSVIFSDHDLCIMALEDVRGATWGWIEGDEENNRVRGSNYRSTMLVQELMSMRRGQEEHTLRRMWRVRQWVARHCTAYLNAVAML